MGVPVGNSQSKTDLTRQKSTEQEVEVLVKKTSPAKVNNKIVPLTHIKWKTFLGIN